MDVYDVIAQSIPAERSRAHWAWIYRTQVRIVQARPSTRRAL